MYDIILASKSPRRSELLTQIGIKFKVMVSEKEEIVTSSIPGDVVKELSLQKANDVMEMYTEKDHNEKYIIIGADTVVAIDDKILGKPKDSEDALNMLTALSGRAHGVYTGVTLIIGDGENVKKDTFFVKTDVYMYDNSKEELLDYISTLEGRDKAGAYGIQGIGARLVEKIEGDYNNVVGLPISAIYNRIKEYI